MQLSLLVFMVSGAALSVAYHDMPWLIMGLAAALRRLVAGEAVGTKLPEGRSISRSPSGRARPSPVPVPVPVPEPGC